ncbi:MAG: hypothetical protein ACLPXZ_26270 [Mycobacterium sp.]
MKAKREAPKRRSSERPGGRDGAARKRRAAMAEPTASRRTRTRPGKTSATEAKNPNSGPQTSPITRPVERTARAKNTSQAKARAKARKAKAPKVVRPKLTERLAARLAEIDLRPRTLISKVPFVVLVIGSLGVGLGLTLWLSTASAERSYQLSHARERTRLLQQQKESLERDVREAESAPALAEAARKQGMIPSRDTAHLVQAPDGSWVVVGDPKPADGVPPPPLNAKLPDEGPPAPPKPPALPPEIAVRVTPVPGAPPVPAPSGPEALLRAPDGASTLGGQHLPMPAAPRLPGAPGQVPAPLPALVPTPGLPVPGGALTAPVPGEVPTPIGGLHLPAPVQVPVPLQPGMALQPGLAPGLAPANGEQFGPVTATAPMAPGAAR